MYHETSRVEHNRLHEYMSLGARCSVHNNSWITYTVLHQNRTCSSNAYNGLKHIFRAISMGDVRVCAHVRTRRGMSLAREALCWTW